MTFPPKPDVLKLNTLEERLVSPVNVFMQMRELPSGGQVCVKGNIVNVLSDNINTVQSLPRRMNESETVPVKLKRRLRYKTHYMYENVRPNRCLEATQYLMEKELYRKNVTEGIDQSWADHVHQLQDTDWNEFFNHMADVDPPTIKDHPSSSQRELSEDSSLNEKTTSSSNDETTKNNNNEVDDEDSDP